MASWTDIHEDFGKEHYYDKTYQTYQQIWEKKDFTYQEAKSWIEKGLTPQEYNFASYLTTIDLGKTRNHYYQAQNWLDLNYPNKKLTKEIKISYLEQLRGSLTISDYPQLETIEIILQGNLTNLQINNCDNLKWLTARHSSQLSRLDLSNNSKLEYLDLTGNNLNQDLSFLRDLVNLKVLRLGNLLSNLGEQEKIHYNRFYGSLEPLQNLSKLENLDISDTDIDSGLEYLPESLRSFYCSVNERPEAKVKVIKEQLNSDSYYTWRKNNLQLVGNQVISSSLQTELNAWKNYFFLPQPFSWNQPDSLFTFRTQINSFDILGMTGFYFLGRYLYRKKYKKNLSKEEVLTNEKQSLISAEEIERLEEEIENFKKEKETINQEQQEKLQSLETENNYLRNQLSKTERETSSSQEQQTAQIVHNFPKSS